MNKSRTFARAADLPTTLHWQFRAIVPASVAGRVRMLFLHIGRHKSGTSSIQHFFNQNRTALERDGILYPAPASGVAHHAWSATIKDVQKGLRDMSALGALRAMVDDYAASANTVVVSSEDFQNILKPELVREALGRHDVTVVAYLREHFAYAWPAYSQRVQANRFTLSFAEFLEDFSQDYLEFLNRWASAFGASSIKARIFDRSHLKSGDVVEDFCALVGIDNPGRYPRRRTANPSIGWRLINAKIEINRSLAGSWKAARVRGCALQSVRGAHREPSAACRKAGVRCGVRRGLSAAVFGERRSNGAKIFRHRRLAVPAELVGRQPLGQRRLLHTGVRRDACAGRRFRRWRARCRMFFRPTLPGGSAGRRQNQPAQRRIKPSRPGETCARDWSAPRTKSCRPVSRRRRS